MIGMNHCVAQIAIRLQPLRVRSVVALGEVFSRASCNGVRDPTTYVKKSQLATPAGVDHDYNFLSKIERAIDRPTTLVSTTEPSSQHGDRQPSTAGRSNAEKKRWNSDGTLVRYLHDNRIRVDRAPTGMSRQKANMTRYLQKSKRIVWTVEWVQADGDKIMTEVYESATIHEAWGDVLKERSRKRKREEEKAETIPTPANSEQDTTETPAAEDKDEEIITRQYFYLQKPHTQSNTTVLIPLDVQATLTTILRDRVVLEFPTIYRLPHPPESLPPKFITEDTYLSKSAGSTPRVGEFVVDSPDPKMEKVQGGVFSSSRAGNHGKDDDDEEEEKLDEKSILDMLRRDAGS
ncbi:hypothetical protein MBLNU457_1289t1 [Dothideomycetes sp. NU457]